MPAFVAVGTKITIPPPVGLGTVIMGGKNRIAAYLTVAVHSYPPSLYSDFGWEQTRRNSKSARFKRFMAAGMDGFQLNHL
jgi:hypothetical protein